MNSSFMIRFLENIPLHIIILACATFGLYKIIQWFFDRQYQIRKEQFDEYHKLIQKLVHPSKESGEGYIDQKKTIIFELTRYPRYFPLTKRMFTRFLKMERWQEHSRICEELNLALEYLSLNYPQRLWWNLQAWWKA